MMARMWFLTVDSDMRSSQAICLFEKAQQIADAMSHSRGVRSGVAWWCKPGANRKQDGPPSTAGIVRSEKGNPAMLATNAHMKMG